VCEHTDDSAVLADSLELASNRLAGRLCVLGGVAGECLLLASVPVLVESSLQVVGKVLGPDGGEGSQTSGCLYVSHDTDDDERRSLNNGGSLDDLTLVHFASCSVKLSDNVGHSSLVSKEGSEVYRLLAVVDWERLDLSAVTGGPLFGQEP